MATCTRKIEFDAGHRVLGHQGKCRFPHGHRYVVEITLSAALNDLGMVQDFGRIKDVLGGWVDKRLDHGFIVNEQDFELIAALESLEHNKIEVVPFNPTAENLAAWLLREFQQELGSSPELSRAEVKRVRLYETPNCWSDAT